MDEILTLLKLGKEFGPTLVLLSYVLVKLIPRINALEVQSAINKARLARLEHEHKVLEYEQEDEDYEK